MNKLAMRTPDLAASNVEKIADIFPHCVTEAHGVDGELQRKIDWDYTSRMHTRSMPGLQPMAQ